MYQYNLGLKFEEIVSLYACNNAILFDKKEVSYEELNHLANRISHLLIEKGAYKGDIVALSSIKNLTTYILFYTILVSAAFFLFFTTLKELFVKKLNNASQTLAHFGFSLLILSILFNSILSSEIITNIRVGEKYSYSKGEIFFKKVKERKESNFNSIIAYFEIKDVKGKIIELKPEIRIYNQPIIITSEADIKTTLLEDKFLVMNLVKGNEFFNIRYQIKPFMVWIWISVLLLSLGGLMSLFKKKI